MFKAFKQWRANGLRVELEGLEARMERTELITRGCGQSVPYLFLAESQELAQKIAALRERIRQLEA